MPAELALNFTSSSTPTQAGIMADFGKKNYKLMWTFLKAHSSATIIAQKTLPEHLHYYIYGGRTDEASLREPLFIIVRPEKYTIRTSPTSCCITIPIQKTIMRLPSHGSAPISPRKQADDQRKVEKMRGEILNFVLEDRLGKILGGGNSRSVKRGLVVIARPGAYYVKVTDRDYKVYMNLEDEQNPSDTLYNPVGPYKREHSSGISSRETSSSLFSEPRLDTARPSISSSSRVSSLSLQKLASPVEFPDFSQVNRFHLPRASTASSESSSPMELSNMYDNFSFERPTPPPRKGRSQSKSPTTLALQEDWMY